MNRRGFFGVLAGLGALLASVPLAKSGWRKVALKTPCDLEPDTRIPTYGVGSWTATFTGDTTVTVGCDPPMVVKTIPWRNESVALPPPDMQAYAEYRRREVEKYIDLLAEQAWGPS